MFENSSVIFYSFRMYGGGGGPTCTHVLNFIFHVLVLLALLSDCGHELVNRDRRTANNGHPLCPYQLFPPQIHFNSTARVGFELIRDHCGYQKAFHSLGKDQKVLRKEIDLRYIFAIQWETKV